MENLPEKNSRNLNRTRILAVGDIHGDTGLAKRLADRAEKEKVDLVILAGDITFAERSIKNLISPFAQVRKPVLLVPGNHESASTIEVLSQVYSNARNLHGYYYVKNNVGIFGAGGADMGINFVEESEIFDLLKKGHEKIKHFEKKVMVTHMHPLGSKSDSLGWPGSAAIAEAIKKFQPDFLINAHLHEASGMEETIGRTRVINVSRKEKIIEL